MPHHRATSSLVKFLHVELAPRMSLHGVLIEVYGEGILILGESGVGKSRDGTGSGQAWSPADRRRSGRGSPGFRQHAAGTGTGNHSPPDRDSRDRYPDVKELYGVSSVKMQEKC